MNKSSSSDPIGFVSCAAALNRTAASRASFGANRRRRDPLSSITAPIYLPRGRSTRPEAAERPMLSRWRDPVQSADTGVEAVRHPKGVKKVSVNEIACRKRHGEYHWQIARCANNDIGAVSVNGRTL
jgi:hypothetical protein